MGQRCLIDGCRSQSVFKLPSKIELRERWLKAMQLPLDFQSTNKRAGLCPKHFKIEDIVTEGYHTGLPVLKRYLKRDVIPSLCLPEKLLPVYSPKKRPRVEVEDEAESDNFACSEPTLYQTSDSDLILLRTSGSYGSEVNLSEGIVCETVVETSCTKCNVGKSDKCIGPERPMTSSVETQTPTKLAPYSIHDFISKPDVLKNLTGIQSYGKFMLIFHSLAHAIHELEYRGSTVLHVSLEDQLFLVLWKLRKAASDVELGMHFGIHHSSASNIFISFVRFMANQWEKLDIWPSRELVDHHMPEIFKDTHSSSRYVLNSTENPQNSTHQQATFSSYESANILKLLMGAGASSARSEGNCGSISDLVMADHGTYCQNTFAPKRVALNNLPSLRCEEHLTGSNFINDWKLASKCVRIKKLIGLAKTYKILISKMNHCYVPHRSDIFFVCVMLTNFRENILPQSTKK